MPVIYLIGSLRNPQVPIIGQQIREAGFDVFDQWFGAGPEADDNFQAYNTFRRHTYKEALNTYAAKHIFEFDKFHLDRSDIGIMLMPAGRSCHLELGYLVGAGKPGYILFDEPPQRYDIMVQFANEIFFHVDDLIETLIREHL